ncbi:cupredoxin domain-containing protein [Methylobrevis albus]|uniref:Copper-binding protein n=1 Tax=Methylobrevis albus TaxID=2793297 RepID=A0A931MYC9_9HYPH|nr:copper-binding protein [Methylobrevis albus]MBH0238282.1 copper-binding protein [Methylobrevis albus]
MKNAIVAAAAVLLSAAPAFAAGDLAIRGTDLPPLELGLGEFGFGVSQNDYELETGKLYQLKITSTGLQECAFISPGLFGNSFFRKVEAGGLEIKAPYFVELEFDEGEAELFFVPVRTGEFPWSCRGLEPRGVQGKFIVK